MTDTALSSVPTGFQPAPTLGSLIPASVSEVVARELTQLIESLETLAPDARLASLLDYYNTTVPAESLPGGRVRRLFAALNEAAADAALAKTVAGVLDAVTVAATEDVMSDAMVSLYSSSDMAVVVSCLAAVSAPLKATPTQIMLTGIYVHIISALCCIGGMTAVRDLMAMPGMLHIVLQAARALPHDGEVVYAASSIFAKAATAVHADGGDSSPAHASLCQSLGTVAAIIAQLLAPVTPAESCTASPASVPALAALVTSARRDKQSMFAALAQLLNGVILLAELPYRMLDARLLEPLAAHGGAVVAVLPGNCTNSVLIPSTTEARFSRSDSPINNYVIDTFSVCSGIYDSLVGLLGQIAALCSGEGDSTSSPLCPRSKAELCILATNVMFVLSAIEQSVTKTSVSSAALPTRGKDGIERLAGYIGTLVQVFTVADESAETIEYTTLLGRCLVGTVIPFCGLLARRTMPFRLSIIIAGVVARAMRCFATQEATPGNATSVADQYSCRFSVDVLRCNLTHTFHVLSPALQRPQDVAAVLAESGHGNITNFIFEEIGLVLIYATYYCFRALTDRTQETMGPWSPLMAMLKAPYPVRLRGDPLILPSQPDVTIINFTIDSIAVLAHSNHARSTIFMLHSPSSLVGYVVSIGDLGLSVAQQDENVGVNIIISCLRALSLLFVRNGINESDNIAVEPLVSFSSQVLRNKTLSRKFPSLVRWAAVLISHIVDVYGPAESCKLEMLAESVCGSLLFLQAGVYASTIPMPSGSAHLLKNASAHLRSPLSDLRNISPLEDVNGSIASLLVAGGYLCLYRSSRRVLIHNQWHLHLLLRGMHDTHCAETVLAAWGCAGCVFGEPKAVKDMIRQGAADFFYHAVRNDFGLLTWVQSEFIWASYQVLEQQALVLSHSESRALLIKEWTRSMIQLHENFSSLHLSKVPPEKTKPSPLPKLSPFSSVVSLPPQFQRTSRSSSHDYPPADGKLVHRTPQQPLGGRRPRVVDSDLYPSAAAAEAIADSVHLSQAQTLLTETATELQHADSVREDRYTILSLTRQEISERSQLSTEEAFTFGDLVVVFARELEARVSSSAVSALQSEISCAREKLTTEYHQYETEIIQNTQQLALSSIVEQEQYLRASIVVQAEAEYEKIQNELQRELLQGANAILRSDWGAKHSAALTSAYLREVVSSERSFRSIVEHEEIICRGAMYDILHEVSMMEKDVLQTQAKERYLRFFKAEAEERESIEMTALHAFVSFQALNLTIISSAQASANALLATENACRQRLTALESLENAAAAQSNAGSASARSVLMQEAFMQHRENLILMESASRAGLHNAELVSRSQFRDLFVVAMRDALYRSTQASLLQIQHEELSHRAVVCRGERESWDAISIALSHVQSAVLLDSQKREYRRAMAMQSAANSLLEQRVATSAHLREEEERSRELLRFSWEFDKSKVAQRVTDAAISVESSKRRRIVASEGERRSTIQQWFLSTRAALKQRDSILSKAEEKGIHLAGLCQSATIRAARLEAVLRLHSEEEIARRGLVDLENTSRVSFFSEFVCTISGSVPALPPITMEQVTHHVMHAEQRMWFACSQLLSLVAEESTHRFQLAELAEASKTIISGLERKEFVELLATESERRVKALLSAELTNATDEKAAIVHAATTATQQLELVSRTARDKVAAIASQRDLAVEERDAAVKENRQLQIRLKALEDARDLLLASRTRQSPDVTDGVRLAPFSAAPSMERFHPSLPVSQKGSDGSMKMAFGSPWDPHFIAAPRQHLAPTESSHATASFPPAANSAASFPPAANSAASFLPAANSAASFPPANTSHPTASVPVTASKIPSSSRTTSSLVPSATTLYGQPVTRGTYLRTEVHVNRHQS